MPYAHQPHSTNTDNTNNTDNDGDVNDNGIDETALPLFCFSSSRALDMLQRLSILATNAQTTTQQLVRC